MANGGDPNSVAAQQANESAASPAPETADEKLIKERHKAEIKRRQQYLNLTRARIVDQLSRTNNENYTAMLNSQLATIDEELSRLV